MNIFEDEPVPLTAAHFKKIEQIKEQFAALLADKYRITLIPRRPGLSHRNFGNVSAKDRRHGEVERFWTAHQVTEQVQILQDLNLRGYDIYITPISEYFHHIVIDDMTEASVRQLLADGYLPALLQESSRSNFQSILCVPKALPEVLDARVEQSLANKIVIELNRKYGDVNFSGVIHPFRLPGFANRKEGRDNFFTVVKFSKIAVCEKTKEHLQSMRDAELQEISASVSIACGHQEGCSRHSASSGSLNHGRGVVLVPDDVAIAEFRRQVERESSRIKDLSRLDLAVVRKMRSLGYPDAQIGSAMAAGSPDIAVRHQNIDYYIRITLFNA